MAPAATQLHLRTLRKFAHQQHPPQSVIMRSAAVGKRSQGAVRNSSHASLSVVVVSTGSSTAQRATQALKAAAHDLTAQFIVVAQDHDPGFAMAVQRNGAEFIAAPKGCSRAEMCDLGMSHVLGTIVAVRDDVSVGDAAWLDAYRNILPKREVPAIAPMESVVMDTLVASRAPLADVPAARVAVESGINTRSIEMAEAV